MKWPTIAVLLLTYQRPELARLTLETFFLHVQYSGRFHVHIADDGSSPAYAAGLGDLAASYHGVVRVSTTNAERGGYGKSFNLATQQLHTDYELVLPLEDDWELVKSFNLDPLVKALLCPLELVGPAPIRCIRLGYIGWTQPLRGEFVAHPGAGQQYLMLDASSPEPHVFAGHPRLETRDFQRDVGPWPEGLPAGETEFVVAHRPAARVGVVWPVDLIPARGGLFAHIGAQKAGE